MSESVALTIEIFILMAVGFSAAKLRFIDEKVSRGLSSLLVDFCLPALIFSSMQRPFSIVLRDEAFSILGLSALIYAASLPLALLLVRALGARGKEAGPLRFAACFSNVGFMGIPVIQALFGMDAVFAVSIFNIPFNILSYSVASLMLAPEPRGDAVHEPKRLNPRSILKSALNPAVLAALVGLLCFLLGLRLPTVLGRTLDLLGSTTTPLSMVLVGSVLARMRLKSAFGNFRVYLVSAYRLFLHPLLVYAALSLAGASGLLLAVPVMIVAMPAAANTTILADSLGGDTETASSLVFVSTLGSLVSIPLMARLLFKV
jgi:malate permease and related proteins